MDVYYVGKCTEMEVGCMKALKGCFFVLNVNITGYECVVSLCCREMGA